MHNSPYVFDCVGGGDAIVFSGGIAAPPGDFPHQVVGVIA